tara:strand:+ start:323 stop:568 length:246 start_codon:yes stop_codon:yes gene_type:complete
MAQIDTKDPKALIAGMLACAGLIGGGSLLGLTIEPEETTELRINHGKLETQVQHLETELAQCNKTLEQKAASKNARQRGSK